MVSLSTVLSSNARIASALPPKLVAVFVGATSGIGEATLKKFAQYSDSPRVYFVGRSSEAGKRIAEECKALNPKGTFTFIPADVSLIRGVDEVSAKIRAHEQTLNVLFLSCGVAFLDRRETAEGIHLLTALIYYSRMRFITNLLLLLQNTSSFARVVTVAGGGLEGPLDTSDFPALRVPLESLHGHIATLITLGLEGVAGTAPEVSFVHDYPGTVDTPLTRRLASAPDFTVPLDESGERHLYLATSAMYPAANPGSDNSIPIALTDKGSVARGTRGGQGDGVYSVGSDCESASSKVVQVLSEMRVKGSVDDIWNHTVGEFDRVTRQVENK